MDFQQFKKLNISEIEKWKYIALTDQEIEQWKREGSLVDRLYDLKLKKLYLEYVKIKLQNMIAKIDPFKDYDPIQEAENILRRFCS